MKQEDLVLIAVVFGNTSSFVYSVTVEQYQRMCRGEVNFKKMKHRVDYEYSYKKCVKGEDGLYYKDGEAKAMREDRFSFSFGGVQMFAPIDVLYKNSDPVVGSAVIKFDYMIDGEGFRRYVNEAWITRLAARVANYKPSKREENAFRSPTECEKIKSDAGRAVKKEFDLRASKVAEIVAKSERIANGNTY